MAKKKSSLRDKYRATSIEKIQKLSDEDDEVQVGTGRKGGSGRLKMQDGWNIFRVYPAKAEDKNFYILRAVHWLPFEDDEGKSINRPVINSVVHGNPKIGKDIVVEYLSLLEGSVESMKTSKAEKIGKVLDDYRKSPKAKKSWVLYAEEYKKVGGKYESEKFGFLEFSKAVKDGINKAMIEDDEDGEITVDPFTDPDTGVFLRVKYDSKAKKAADYYSVRISKNSVRIPDDKLENFDENVKSLTKLYRNIYSIKDFEKALEGLKNFDDAHGIGLFDESEFESIAEEIRELVEKYGADVDEEEEDEKPKKKKSKKRHLIDEEEVEGSEDEDDEEEDEEEDSEEVDEDEEDEDEKPKKSKKKKSKAESLKNRIKDKKKKKRKR